MRKPLDAMITQIDNKVNRREKNWIMIQKSKSWM